MAFSGKMSAAETGLNLLLITVSPLQSLIDRPGLTHQFCNRQALHILRNDGFTHHADFFANYLTELNFGVLWADKDWKNIHHYFEPYSGKGLWQFANAIDNFNLYYEMASSTADRRDFKKAAFFLGAAAHLGQDLCVPHHARAKLFCGHSQYESWVQQHYAEYAVVSGGIYLEDQPPSFLLLYNANLAADFLPWLTPKNGETYFASTTAALLTIAQRTTAGLFWQFARQIFCPDSRPVPKTNSLLVI